MSLGQIAAGLGAVGASTAAGYYTGGTGGAVCGFIGSVTTALVGTQLTGNGNKVELAKLKKDMASKAGQQALNEALTKVDAAVKTAVDNAIGANKDKENVVKAAKTAARSAVAALKAANPLRDSPVASQLNTMVEQAGAEAYAETRLLSKGQKTTEELSNTAREQAKVAKAVDLILTEAFSSKEASAEAQKLGLSPNLEGIKKELIARRKLPMEKDAGGNLFQTHIHDGRNVILGRNNKDGDILINHKGTIRTINLEREEREGYVNFARSARLATFPALFAGTMIAFKAAGLVTGGAALGFATAILWPAVIVAGIALLAFAARSYTHYKHEDGDKSMVKRQTARILLTPFELVIRGVAGIAAAGVIVLNILGAKIGDPYASANKKIEDFHASIK